VIFFFVFGRLAISVGFEVHRTVIGFHSKSLRASEKVTAAINYSGANYGTGVILESLLIRNHRAIPEKILIPEHLECVLD
jgi:hypothetical protein